MERTTLFGKNRVEFWACNDSESFATIRVATIADQKKEADLVRLEPYEIRKMEIQKKQRALRSIGTPSFYLYKIRRIKNEVCNRRNNR